jgi:hypothetical protein
VQLGDTEVFIPRWSSIADWDEDEDYITVLSWLKGNYDGPIMLLLFYAKNEDKQFMNAMFEYDVKDITADMMPLAYIYRCGEKKLLLFYEMSWEVNSITFPFQISITIPDKKLEVSVGLREISIEKALDVVKEVVYNDSSLIFELDTEETKKYMPWVR